MSEKKFLISFYAMCYFMPYLVLVRNFVNKAVE